jgi:hypothetical protein
LAIGALLIGGLLMATSIGAQTKGFELRVSGSASRSPSNSLAQSTLQGNAYVFTTPDSGVKRVSFYIDDAKMTRPPFRVENWAPFDLAGTASNGSAVPFDTKKLADGAHTITAAVLLTGGSTVVVSSTFNVANAASTVAGAPRPKILFGIGPEADGALKTRLVQEAPVKMLTSWYNGPGDLSWMTGWRTNLVPQAYASGKALHLIVWAGDAEVSFPTKYGTACGRSYPLSDRFLGDMRQLAATYAGSPGGPPLYVTLFTEFQTYPCVDNQWSVTPEVTNYYRALKDRYVEAIAVFHQYAPNSKVSLGWGGWQARWDAPATGGGRSLFGYFADVMRASDFQSFQAMASDSNIKDIKDMTTILGAYGKVLLAHYKPDNGSQTTFDTDLKTVFTDAYLTDLTSAGLFGFSFMDNANLSSSESSYQFVKSAVTRYANTATTIVTAATTISPSTLPGATVGAAYSAQFTVSGPNPPYGSFRVSSGTLPGGLTLTVGGVLSGAPTAGGSFTFTVSATDATNVATASRGLTLTVTAPSGTRLPGIGIAAGADLQTWTSTNLNRQLDDYGRIHARWIRHDFAWDAIQPLQATFNWGGFDQLVSAARARNINVIATITYTPAWANGGHNDHHYQPSSASQFAQFAGQVAARYAPQGVHTYEIWNEPNIGFWQPVPNPLYYAQVLCASYQAIHSADPEAVVITGGTSPAADSSTTVSPQTWLSKLYTNGARSCFDAVGHHPYVDSSSTHGDLGNAWDLMYDAYPPSNLRGIMSNNGDSAKRIFATELGCDRVRLGDTECSYRIQKAMQLWSSFSWAGALAWFIYWDPNVYGLVDGNWNPRPEWSAFQSGATTYFG